MLRGLSGLISSFLRLSDPTCEGMSDLELISAYENSIRLEADVGQYQSELHRRIGTCADWDPNIHSAGASSMCEVLGMPSTISRLVDGLGLNHPNVLMLLREAMYISTTLEDRIVGWFTSLDASHFGRIMRSLNISMLVQTAPNDSQYVLLSILGNSVTKLELLTQTKSLVLGLMSELIQQVPSGVSKLGFFAPGLGSEDGSSMNSYMEDPDYVARRSLLGDLSMLFIDPFSSLRRCDWRFEDGALEELWDELEQFLNSIVDRPIIESYSFRDFALIEPVFVNYFASAGIVRADGFCERLQKWKLVIHEYGTSEHIGQTARWLHGPQFWRNVGGPAITQQCSNVFGGLSERKKYFRKMIASHRTEEVVIRVRRSHVVEDSLDGMLPAPGVLSRPRIIFSDSNDEINSTPETNLVEWVTLVIQQLLTEGVLVRDTTTDRYGFEQGVDQTRLWLAGVVLGTAIRYDVPVPVYFTADVFKAVLGWNWTTRVSGSLIASAMVVRQGAGVILPMDKFERLFDPIDLWQIISVESSPDEVARRAINLRQVLSLYSDDALVELVRIVNCVEILHEAVGEMLERMDREVDWPARLTWACFPSFYALLNDRENSNATTLLGRLLEYTCDEDILPTVLGYVLASDSEGYRLYSAQALLKLIKVHAASCDTRGILPKSYHYASRLMFNMAQVHPGLLYKLHDEINQEVNVAFRKLFFELGVFMAGVDWRDTRSGLMAFRLPAFQSGSVALGAMWLDVVAKVNRLRIIPEWSGVHREILFAMEPAVVSYIALWPIIQGEESLSEYCALLNLMGRIKQFYATTRDLDWAKFVDPKFWTDQVQTFIQERCAPVWHTVEYHAYRLSGLVVQTSLIPILVDRDNILESLVPESLSRDSIPRITFQNEPGVDAGGLRREWYSLMAGEIENRGLFELVPDAQNTHRVRTGANPQHMYIIGKVIGRAIIDGVSLGVGFTDNVFRALLGERTDCLEELRSEDPQLYTNLWWIHQSDPNTPGYLEALNDMVFQVSAKGPDGIEMVDLKPGGAQEGVTHENKYEFIAAVCDYKTRAVMAAIAPFVEGFHSLIPLDSMVGIVPLEALRGVVSGTERIDVNDLIAHMRFSGGYDENSEPIVWLVEELRSYPEDQLRKFIAFVTGSEHPPRGGFRNLRKNDGSLSFISVVEGVLREGGKSDRLPTSATCFFVLRLPRYATRDAFKKNLMIAIQNGQRGFGIE